MPVARSLAIKLQFHSLFPGFFADFFKHSRRSDWFEKPGQLSFSCATAQDEQVWTEGVFFRLLGVKKLREFTLDIFSHLFHSAFNALDNCENLFILFK